MYKHTKIEGLPSIQCLEFSMPDVLLHVGTFSIEESILVARVKDFGNHNIDVDCSPMESGSIPLRCIPALQDRVYAGLASITNDLDANQKRLVATATIMEKGKPKKYIAVGSNEIYSLRDKIFRIPRKFVLETMFPKDHWDRINWASTDRRTRSATEIKYADRSRTGTRRDKRRK